MKINNHEVKKILLRLKYFFTLLFAAIISMIIIAYIVLPLTINTVKLEKLTIENDILRTITSRVSYAALKTVNFDILDINDELQTLNSKVDNLTKEGCGEIQKEKTKNTSSEDFEFSTMDKKAQSSLKNTIKYLEDK